MLQAVQNFHEKPRFRETGGEEMTYRIALMSEELGEISACVTKGRSKNALTEELADLFILLIGTALARELDLDLDLGAAFWDKMEKLDRRESCIIDGRIRVSEFRDTE